METLNYIFEDNRDLDWIQMTVRSFLVFFVALILLRISGRRSFGLTTPLDVVVAILLGGMLGRAIAGVSPFWPCLVASATLVIIHRICGLLGIYSKTFGMITKGEEKIVYEKGEFIKKNMLRCMVSKHDLLEGVRQSTHVNSFDNIERIYIERDGKMSVITKDNKT